MNDFLIDSTPSINKYKRTTVLIILTVVLFTYIYNKRCAIKEIIGSVMIVLIKKIINNLPMLTGIFEPSMTPPTSDKYINCDILSAPITKRVISFCTPSINIEGKTYRQNR